VLNPHHAGSSPAAFRPGAVHTIDPRGARAGAPCPRHFAISCGAGGRWTLEGCTASAPASFDNLAAALAFARGDSNAGEATIELRVDGLYVCVHQPKGWPQRIRGKTAAA